MQNFIKYRSVTDVYADQVIQDYFQSDKKDKLRSLALFNILTQNFGPIPTELPSYFKEYFEKPVFFQTGPILKKFKLQNVYLLHTDRRYS